MPVPGQGAAEVSGVQGSPQGCRAHNAASLSRAARRSITSWQFLGYGPAPSVAVPAGPAGPGRAYRPWPVLQRKPRRVHSPSWVSRFRGFTPSRLASSLPDQSWPGWLAGHDAGDLVSSAVRAGLAGTGCLVRAAGARGGTVRRRDPDRDLHPGDRHGLAGAGLVTFLVADVVAGGGAFDLAGAVARAAGGQQAGKDGTADPAGVGWVCGVRDAAGCGDLVAGGLQRDGEAGPGPGRLRRTRRQRSWPSAA